jgi:hypothetical protein
MLSFLCGSSFDATPMLRQDAKDVEANGFFGQMLYPFSDPVNLTGS